MAKSFSEDEMIRQGCILPKTVDQAFRNYKSVIVSADEKGKMHTFLKCVYEANENRMFADFYYPVLNPVDQQKFYDGLNEEEKMMLLCFENENQQIYFKIEEKELDFLFEISAREWLFSSFYMVNRKAVIWGNYGLEFPVFCENEKDLEFYIDLAKKCGLEWH